jgi:hypothetical protein
MAGRERPHLWDTTFRRVRVRYLPQWDYPPRTTAAELDSVEKELGFRFPDSYREFAQQFGLGGDLLCSLPKLWPLRQPKWPADNAWFRSVVSATHFYRTHEWHLNQWDEDAATLPFFRRVIPFAQDGGYHDWVFDPMEVTDPDTHEYRIYDINRSYVAEAVAFTFEEWLRYIDESYRFPNEEEDDEEAEFDFVHVPSPSEDDSIIFARDILHLNQKKAPKRDVKKWLAWNDGTARTLAETIRHQHRPDLFPILADALEDAGCTNADVLRSCRTGDPAVDGVWVLQVLLGKPAAR